MSSRSPAPPVPTSSQRLLCLSIAACLAAMCVPVQAAAETSVDADANAALDAGSDRAGNRRSRELPGVEVEGKVTARASSVKYTAPLRDTPQSITVVSEDLIVDQNLLTLREVLSTLPGITFGAGEGGGGYGDSINLRGFNANNDITVDGIRDSAQYTRSDPFNLEQIELINGANSVYSGAGSVGGTINLVSKRARLDDFSLGSIAVGTDDYRRLTADANRVIGDTTGVRLNVMAHQNDVPNREFETYERWGIAPSIGFGLGTDTSVTLSYVHQKDENIPQYGVPFYNGRPLPGIDLEDYFGYANFEHQDIVADAFTVVVDHTFSDQLSVRNQSRYQAVDQDTLVGPPQGTYCLTGINLTPTGLSCGTVLPGNYLPTGPRGLLRETENSIIVNQTDFTARFDTGSVGHTLVAGTAVFHETFELDSINIYRNPDGTTVPFPQTPYTNPDPIYNGPVNPTLTGKTDGELENAAVYVFDTLKFSDHWLFNAGARYERNEGSSTLYTVSTNPPTIGQVTGAAAPAKNDDNLFSYRAGLVYKPVENHTYYLAYGNSETPSKASVNGSCTAVSSTSTTAGTANCNVAPEEAVSYELGGKWDLFDARLSLTASIFRNDRQNYRVSEPANPLNPSGEQQLDGHARVDGVALGASGFITEGWAVYANYAYLDSEVLQGVSDLQAGNGLDYTRGDALTNTPRHSASLWSTYDVAPRWQLGYGMTAQGKYFLNQHSVSNINGPLVTAPGYTTHRAMVTWRFSRNLDFRLNVNNVLDKTYFRNIRNNGWAVPGDGRQFVLSANFMF